MFSLMFCSVHGGEGWIPDHVSTPLSCYSMEPPSQVTFFQKFGNINGMYKMSLMVL